MKVFSNSLVVYSLIGILLVSNINIVGAFFGFGHFGGNFKFFPFLGNNTIDDSWYFKKLEEREKRIKDFYIKKVIEKRKEFFVKRKEVINKVKDKINTSVVLKSISDDINIGNYILKNPVVDDSVKEKIKKKFNNVIDSNIENNDILNKVLGSSIVKQFALPNNFDPKRVVTFDDIRKEMIKNLMLYERLLNCNDADDSVIKVCEGITNLLKNLSYDNKKLTINDVYLLLLYQNVISQAIYYEGVLQQYKKAAVVMGIDKSRNKIKSIDVVRDYTIYDSRFNDVLPFSSSVSIDIAITDKVPVGKDGELKIVLGLRGGSVVGIRLYPLDKNLYIPMATTYKVMTIKDFVKGCNSGKYTDSIWYGYGKLGLSHNGVNLEPKGTRGVKFNLVERCYETFNK